MTWTHTRPSVFLTFEDAVAQLGRAPRVLLAEQDAALRTALTTFLESRGHDVEVAGDAQLLEQLLHRCAHWEHVPWTPDVVITGVHVGRDPAMQTLRRARHAGIPTPVLLVCEAQDGALRRDVALLEDAEVFEAPLDLEALELTLLHAACGCTPPH